MNTSIKSKVDFFTCKTKLVKICVLLFLIKSMDFFDSKKSIDLID